MKEFYLAVYFYNEKEPYIVYSVPELFKIDKGLIEFIKICGTDEKGARHEINLELSSSSVLADNAGASTELNSNKLLGKLLVESNIISSQQLEDCLEEQMKSKYNKKLGEILVEKNLVTTQQLLETLAKQLGILLK